MGIKAMIFAAGLGTRLKPFTLNHPKAMVEVGGRPMLEHVIRRLVRAGITEIVVNVHHFAQEIIEYIKHNPTEGVKIYISNEESVLLDTGGGILNARQWLKDADAVLVHNADILTDVNIPAILDDHTRSDADATLLVAERDTTRYLFFDRNTGKLRGWKNFFTDAVKPADFIPNLELMDKRAYAGVHVFNPRIFTHLEQYAKENGKVFSIIPFYIANCNILDIREYEQSSPYHWLDIGKPETLVFAEELLPKLK